jgi:precorrin-4/cobalt-precorrin-4 C11-methyltransferase
MKTKSNPVIFAGAGPGDPDLITVRASRALEQADLVIYAGSLVPEAVLCWKGKDTRAVSSAGMDLGQIIEMISEYHEAGKRVVRLHTGDPSLYGAILEQMRELDRLNIPYRVIPGVTAAFAAAASMSMEYTLPDLTQTLILTRISGRTKVPDRENFEKLASHGASMAVYLSMGHVSGVQKALEKHYGKDSLCAVAYKVSHPEEKIMTMKIRDLEKVCSENSITRHALIIAGKCVEAVMVSRDMVKSKLYDPLFSHGYRRQND